LTVGAGARLDRSLDFEPFQLFGHPFNFLRPRLARLRATKLLTKKLARPRFGRAAGGAIQTGPTKQSPCKKFELLQPKKRISAHDDRK
jgi:hypothetical protein